ncbi:MULTISPECIES: 2-hydroxyacid dehydrogenase [Halomonadaceae]|uniref:Glyoxylate/hydroxypyruvate reductase A n=1 Tax=Vreelandella janggokensis TaxID=370767 RepID=A0ABT4IY03_9GAMM|nr:MULTISPECIES: glyoxylate/hydroxypyruvate reductase A [Halomonas]MCW4148960.1 glyoxylate/hydroxypyruvate reductase A [Halomonas sp. 18H]MCZ0927859.1 glyoxylate/hydroxypyruvate reductase A [Halomonas janggokensis]MCZ0930683.1 glyoxylate/hydroxypyruvate reductase A [Halomonas janggokensis]MDR5884511.1 glyoxylate/hydroxypyruvate reductase A [Halomonas janggokensis]
MKIIVHIDEAAAWQNALADAFPDAQVVTSDAPADQRQNADYLAVWKAPAHLIEEQTHLKGIINLGAGVDYLLKTPGLPTDVPIVKLRDAGMGELMADYVLYGVLHFYRSMDRYAAQQQDATWQPQDVVAKSQWPVGVLGLGAIGRYVAGALHQAGFPVLGWSRSPKQITGVHCYHGDEGLAALLGQVQTVVTILPDTAATRHILDAQQLAKLPKGASVINPGRGSLIDEQALLEALGHNSQPGHIRGALLDVFEAEPLSDDHPLWQHPRVIITPHMAAPTPLNDAIDQVIAYIKALEAGESVTTIDPEAGY